MCRSVLSHSHVVCKRGKALMCVRLECGAMQVDGYAPRRYTPLSRGAAERRPLGRSHAVQVSDRLNLSIPDLDLKRPGNELDMVMRVVWCTHRTSRHGLPWPKAL